jgi:hypothetical protein
VENYLHSVFCCSLFLLCTLEDFLHSMVLTHLALLEEIKISLGVCLPHSWPDTDRQLNISVFGSINIVRKKSKKSKFYYIHDFWTIFTRKHALSRDHTPGKLETAGLHIMLLISELSRLWKADEISHLFRHAV